MSRPHDRIVAIQGLRAIAIILVLLYHLDLPVGAGFIGVDVFFVISGFVITRMILRRQTPGRRLDLKTFWAGRIRRLMPALASMVLLTVAAATLLVSPINSQTDTALTGASAIAWVANGYLAFAGSGYFAAAAEDNPLVHTWSLAVEEQFYLFFPLLVTAALWRTRRKGGSSTARIGRWIGVTSVISLASCLVLTFVELPLPVGDILAFYSPLTRAWEFGAGALLAVAVARGWRPAAWSRWSFPLGLAILGVGLTTIEQGANFPGWVAILPVVATTLLLIASVFASPGSGLLKTRPMVYLGDLSYSWYLYHWPVIVFVNVAWAGEPPWQMTVVAMVCGLALAMLSYHFLEEPIRSRRALPRLRIRFLAGLVTIPTVLASTLLYAGAAQGWHDPEIREMQRQLDHGQWNYQKVCQAPVPVNRRDMTSCRVEGDPSKRPLILVGDSNAGVYAELMVDIAADLDRTITIATVPSCAMVDVNVIGPNGTSWLDCHRFYDSSMKWLSTQDPSTVVMAAGMAAVVDEAGYGLERADGVVVTDHQRKQLAWQQALEHTYRQLIRYGHDPVQVELAPHFTSWRPGQCSLLKMVRQGSVSCGQEMSRGEADENQAGALAALAGATKQAGVPRIVVRGTLCPGGVCRTNIDDTWFYEDPTHLSFGGALSLKPTFLRLLGEEHLDDDQE